MSQEQPFATRGTTWNPPFVVTFNGSVASIRDKDGQPVPWLVVEKLMNQCAASERPRIVAPHVDGQDFYELCQQYRGAKEMMPHGVPNVVQAFNNLREYIKTGKLPWPSHEGLEDCEPYMREPYKSALAALEKKDDPLSPENIIAASAVSAIGTREKIIEECAKMADIGKDAISEGYRMAAIDIARNIRALAVKRDADPVSELIKERDQWT